MIKNRTWITYLGTFGSLASIFGLLFVFADDLGLSLLQTAAVSFCFLAVFGAGWIVGRHGYRSQILCKLVNNRSGQASVAFLETAEHVFVTRFQDNIPTERYILTMLERIEQKKTQVIRVLPAGLDTELSQYEWLKRFEAHRNDGTYYYREIEVKLSLPFDIGIFDDNILTVSMPRHTTMSVFSQDLLFESERMTAVFRTCLDWFIAKYRV